MSNIQTFLEKIISARYGKDVRQSIHDAIEEIDKVADTAQGSATEAAEIAVKSASDAEQYRNEAKQYRDEAVAVAGVEFATTEKAGLVKPDGTTITVDPDGTIHSVGSAGTIDYEELENKPSINNVELSGNKTLEELGIASKEELDKTVFKVDTIIEKADLGIKETAIGEEIHLTDSADGKAVEYALYGKATQDGTPSPENPVDIEVAGESYNLLENTATSKTVNNVSYVINADGSITVNGTTVNSYADLLINTVTLPIGNYVMKPTGAGWNCYFTIIDKDTDELMVNGGDGKFSLEKETTVKVIVTVGKNMTVNNLTVYPMLVKQTLQNDRYMPYGVGSVEVKSCGKNILDFSNGAKTGSGITYTYNADGSVTANGTASGHNSCYKSVKLPKGTYILSGSPSNGSYTKYFISTSIGSYDYGKGVTFTLESKTTITFYLGVRDGYTANNLTFYPMIRLATDTDDTYEPYKGKNSTIPTTNGLAGIKVESGGNYTDTNGQQWICDEVVKYADGSGAYIQRLVKVVFDGSDDEQWGKSGNTSNNSYYIEQPLIAKGNNAIIGMLCNRFVEFNVNDIVAKDTVGCSYGVHGASQIRLGFGLDSEITTVELLKEWLSNNPLEMICVLATQITTPLTAEELAEISTFYPVTNISNDFDCGMKVKYKCDGKNYIDKRLALIEQALINNI